MATFSNRKQKLIEAISKIDSEHELLDAEYHLEINKDYNTIWFQEKYNWFINHYIIKHEKSKEQTQFGYCDSFIFELPNKTNGHFFFGILGH